MSKNDLEHKIIEQELFIKNILIELKDIYQQFDILKKNASSMASEFRSLLIKLENK